MNKRLKVGDWVVRRLDKQGTQWKDHCKELYLQSPYREFQVTCMSANGLLVQLNNVLAFWNAENFQKFTDHRPLNREDYL